MAQHSRYWSCSSFANWLRGTEKPWAETSEGWNSWRRIAKKSHPYRFWLAEEGLGYLQDFVTWPARKLHSVKYYINNRWVTKSHALTAHPRDIKPGTWRDVGNRFLPCLFNELVDFIEIEQAWSHIAWGSKEDRAKYNPPFWASGWFRWRTWRSPQAGLDHLEWASNLNGNEFLTEGHKDWNKPTRQALAAREQLELYKWWTVTRPARPDPYEVSGWTAICARRRDKRNNTDDDDDFLRDDKTPAEKKETRKALEVMRKMEAQYEKEDEEMMIRLIKIRHSLWT